MARTFVKASLEKVTLSLGALNFIPPFTCAAICTRAVDASVHAWLRIGGTDGSAHICRLNTSNQIEYSIGTGSSHGTTTAVAADGWMLLAASKNTGTVAARLHKYKFSTNAWVHEDGTATLANPGTPTANAWIGSSPASYDGDIAIVGVWNAVLSDAQVEALPFSLASWFQVTPKGIWLLDQQATAQKVRDLTGNGANESALTGSTVSTSSVPIFSYGTPIIKVERQPAAAGGGGANAPRDLLLLGAG
jgi:hypothetical protein